MPSRWEQVQGLLRSGADFRARRLSTNGADLKALEVFCEWSTTGKAVVQDRGETFEAVVDRPSACYVVRTRRQKEINLEPDCGPVMTTRREESRFTMIDGLGNVDRARPSPH
jgi:hypothetical protein